MKVSTIAIENLIAVYNNADAELSAWYAENNAEADRLDDFRYAKDLIEMHNDDCWWMVDRAESYGLKEDVAHWAAEVVKPLNNIEDFNYAAFLSTNDMTKWVN